MAKDIVSISVLSNKLDDEFSWRRKELSILNSKIPSAKSSFQSVILRAAVPLLYAHWEGFVKVSMSLYLEHISRKYLKHNELKTKFIALSLQNKLGDLNNNNDFEVKTRIIDFIFSDINKQSNIPKKNIINTKSNLKFDVLKDILFLLDLEDNHIDNSKELIDDLVETRNFIAHGEYNLVDYNTFSNLYADIIALMEYLKTKIENNAIGEKYRDVGSSEPNIKQVGG